MICPFCGMARRRSPGPQIIYLCGTTALDEDSPHFQTEACDRIDALQCDNEKWRAIVEELQNTYDTT